MVRSVRVKEFIFAQITPTSGANISEVFTLHNINGQIDQVEFTTGNTGSLFLTVSGTGETVWSSVTPSGASTQIVYPMTFAVDNTNATGSPDIATQRVVNNQLVLAGSGMIAATVDLTFRYR